MFLRFILTISRENLMTHNEILSHNCRKITFHYILSIFKENYLQIIMVQLKMRSKNG